MDKRPETMERITNRALADKFIEEQLAEIKAQVGDKKVLLALSGGVDSSVVAALLIKAIGDNLVCVHVNHGLLRKGEPEMVVKVFREELGANLIYVDAVDRFLDKLAGVDDPETKRKMARSLSKCSQKKPQSSRVSSSSDRVLSIRTFLNRTVSKHITM